MDDVQSWAAHPLFHSVAGGVHTTRPSQEDRESTGVVGSTVGEKDESGACLLRLPPAYWIEWESPRRIGVCYRLSDKDTVSFGVLNTIITANCRSFKVSDSEAGWTTPFDDVSFAKDLRGGGGADHPPRRVPG